MLTSSGNSTAPTPYFEKEGLAIFRGDCRAVLPALASGSVDLVVTDPPYLVNYTGRWGGPREAIVGDGDAWSRVLPVFSELWQVLRDDSFAVTFYGWPHADVFVGTSRPWASGW